MPNAVTDLYSYPVKGLGPHRWERVTLSPGGAFPYDRAWSLKKGDWGFDPANPEFQFKTNFHILMQNEKLAELSPVFDPETATLTLTDRAGGVVSVALAEREGRATLETWLKNFLGEDVEVLTAKDHSFADFDMKVASLINLNSVKALGKAVGADLDPVRFRGNIQFEGEVPWAEFDLVDKWFKIGTVMFETVKRISRCAATNVNLESAPRDQNLPKALMQNFGHPDMGIYAQVIEAGTIVIGDEILPV
ncbi:MAG: MOSC domain-containing protein [Alphaproteobacteria bacterium]|nr:MAG: MOSC domain-containing protein [Alphaproteobacteria bacterium]